MPGGDDSTGFSAGFGRAAQVDSAVSIYVEVLEQSGRAGHTIASTRGDLRQLARFLGRQSIDSVGTDDLRGFFRWLERQRGNKVSSLRRKTSSVKGLFAFLHSTGKIPSDVAAAIPYPALKVDRPRPLGRAEADAVFAVAEAASWRVLVGLLLDCGLKRDEIVALHWEDLETAPEGSTERVHIRRRQASRRVRHRVLGVSQRLRDAIDAYRGHGHTFEGPLLAISPRGVDFVVETLARRAGVRPHMKVTPQMLRDAFAMRRMAEMRARERKLEPGSDARSRLEGQHDLILLRELGLSDRGDAARRYRRLLDENEADWAE